jgi:PAS domain S-box-containing protein
MDSNFELNRLHRLLATSPGVLYICRASGDYGATYVSENVRLTLGYTPEDFVSDATFWISRIHPEDAQGVFASLHRLFEQGFHKHEYRFRHADGRYVWMHDELRLIRDPETGEPVEITGCWMDITDRKLAEEALRKSEAHYRMTARATNDVLWTWSAATDIVEYSESFVEKFGHASCLSSFDWWVQHVHPEDRDHVVASVLADMNGTASEWSGEYKFQRADGSYAEVLDRFSILRDASGKCTGLVGALIDLTEKNRLQRQIIHADRLAAVGTLAAGVGHEINNPLSYVMSNLRYSIESLTKWRSSMNPPRLDEIVASLVEAESGAERVRRIVKDLKLFARSPNACAEEVGLERPLESAINMAMHEVRRKAKVVKEYGPAVKVRADEARLGQVFLNLLMNAAHAIQEGSAEEHQITIRTTFDERHATVEIADTGHGIAPEDLCRIFNPFFTTKPIGEGTGLGLSISHQIVSEIGGDISVESTVGKGSTFRVRLPAERINGVSSSAQSRLPRALIIDDEPGVARGVGRLIAEQFSVDTATSGHEAIGYLTNGARYDLIVCDVMMPKMTGMEFHRWVAEHMPNLVQRIVFMTGGVFTQEARAFFQRTQNPCLEKPIEIDELRRLGRDLTAVRINSP